MSTRLESLHDADVKPSEVRKGTSTPLEFAEALAHAETGPTELRAEVLESLAHAATLPLVEDHTVGETLCQRCEVLPRKLGGRGTLHMNMPHTHTLGKVLAWLVRTGATHSRSEGTVRIEIEGGALGPLLKAAASLLAATERRDTRAVFQPAGEPMRESDYFKIESLGTLVAKEEGNWLIDLLREDRLTSHFQPIVRADSGTEIHGYECLLRAEADGRPVIPGLIFETARRADLLFQVDMAARRSAVTGAAAHGLRAHHVFINFTPNAIYDPEHCLDSTVRMVDAARLDRRRVVFEVTEADKLPDLGHLVKIVDYYRAKGFAVALDDLGSGYASLQVLIAIKPDYVKLDMSLTRNVDRDPDRAILARKLIEASQEMGLKVIAEGIETRGEWDWIREHGVDFAQGYIFARPARVPPVVAGSAARA